MESFYVQRRVVMAKRLLDDFNNNKVYYLSVLYLCAVCRDAIWYAGFGIDVFSYINIQDTLMSLFKYFIGLFLIIINVLLWNTLIPKVKKPCRIFPIIFKVLGIVFLSLTYFFMFKKIVSLIIVVYLVLLGYNLIMEGKKLSLIAFSTFFLVLFSLVEPLYQSYMITSIQKYKATNFIYRNINADLMSFEYNNMKYNIKKDDYFVIGNTRAYLFLYNKDKNISYVLPKTELKNITSKPYNFNLIENFIIN